MVDVRARHLGFCPICESDFKLREATLVHHGFTRPGDGYIHGDCIAVGALPYELSDEICHTYQEGCRDALKVSESYLGRLERGEVKTFLVAERGDHSRFPKMIEITVVNVNFDRTHEGEVRSTKSRIHGLNREIQRMQKWIDGWTLKPVRTIQEEMESKRAATQVRKEERDAKRAAKQAKLDAIAAKNKSRHEEKVQLMTKYKEIFVELANQDVTDEIKIDAFNRFLEMLSAKNKKAYLRFWEGDMGIDETFVKLGVAKWDTWGNGQKRLNFTRY